MTLRRELIKITGKKPPWIVRWGATALLIIVVLGVVLGWLIFFRRLF